MLFLIETSYTMNNDKNLPSGVMDNALKLKEYLEKGGVKNIEIYFYDLISGAHIGPGSLAVFYVAKDAY